MSAEVSQRRPRTPSGSATGGFVAPSDAVLGILPEGIAHAEVVLPRGDAAPDRSLGVRLLARLGLLLQIVLKWICFSLSITLIPFGIKVMILNSVDVPISLDNLCGNGELFLIATALAASSIVSILEADAPIGWKLTIVGSSVVLLVFSSSLFAILASVEIALGIEKIAVFVQEDEIRKNIEQNIMIQASAYFLFFSALVYLLSMVIREWNHG